MKDTLMELVETCEKVKAPKKVMNTQPLVTKGEELKMLGLEAMAKEILNKATNEERQKTLAGFIKITDADIEIYLTKKVEEYNKKKRGKAGTDPTGRDAYFYDMMRAEYRRMPNPNFEALEEWYQHERRQIERSYRPDSYGYAMMDRLEREYQRRRESMPESIAYVGPQPRPNNPDSTFSKRTCDYTSTKDGAIGQFVWEEVKLKDYKGIPPQKVLNRLREIIGLKIFDYFTIASVKSIKDPLLLGKIDGCEDRFFCDQWGEDVKIEELM